MAYVCFIFLLPTEVVYGMETKYIQYEVNFPLCHYSCQLLMNERQQFFTVYHNTYDLGVVYEPKSPTT